MEDSIKSKVNELMESMQSLHFPTAYVYSVNKKLNILASANENELEIIYNLIESHAPGVRYTTVERYQKALGTADDNNTVLNRNEVNFKCSSQNNKKINVFLDYLTEMPKEWAIVQLTSQYTKKENLNMHPEKCYTNTLHLTVLNCGANQVPPLTIELEPPIDGINGNIIEIRQEMHDILRDNEIHLSKFRDKYKSSMKFISRAEKLIYVDDRNLLNNRLEGLVNVIQNKWLDTWRCLFIGKFVNDKIEKKVRKLVEDLLKEHNCHHITEKNKILLMYLIKGSAYLRLASSKKGLKQIFPRDEDKDIRSAFTKLMQSKEFNFEKEKRHPLILIVDEPLDFIPWEMIDILQKQSVSRLPSLHFAYSLFKEHRETIVNGFFEIYSTSNATYMLNPGLDLNAMQKRMHNYFNYWRPDWSGIVGIEPSEDVFLETLTTSDIFIYCGHGSGTQFLRGEIIQRTKINSIVFLFGCGSIKLCSIGPQAEISSSYFNYLIASSPCVIGMLWIVTDFETDSLATELFSQWIPSEASAHWSLIAKDKWAIDGSINVTTNNQHNVSEVYLHEPELLKALSNARKASGKYITRAACVARGLPVKIIIK